MNADNHGGRHLGSLQIQSASGRARPRKRGSASRKAALFTAAFVASTAIYGHSMHADANSRGIGEDPTCIKYEETKRMLRSVSPSSYKRYSPAYSGSFGDRCKNPSQCRKELKSLRKRIISKYGENGVIDCAEELKQKIEKKKRPQPGEKGTGLHDAVWALFVSAVCYLLWRGFSGWE